MEAMRQKLRSEEGKRIYKKRGYTVEPVFGQIKWDGTVSLPGKYGKLIEEAMPGSREEQLTLIGAEV